VRSQGAGGVVEAGNLPCAWTHTNTQVRCLSEIMRYARAVDGRVRRRAYSLMPHADTHRHKTSHGHCLAMPEEGTEGDGQSKVS
jgi:hypothetical protein